MNLVTTWFLQDIKQRCHTILWSCHYQRQYLYKQVYMVFGTTLRKEMQLVEELLQLSTRPL